MDDVEVWKQPFEHVLATTESHISGLTESEAAKRLAKYGPNTIHRRRISLFDVIIRQFKSNPLILVLAVATFVSLLLGQRVSSIYIFAMIILSVLLGVWDEYSAERTVDLLLKKISPLALIIRNDEKKEIPASQLTVGDIVLLSQGSIVPADLRLISAKSLQVNESALTGESEAIDKTTDAGSEANIAFMGTAVNSGSGKGVVFRIGKSTQFGSIAQSTVFIKPETDFEKGLTKFGKLLVKVILILTIIIFAVNAFFKHTFLEPLLFSLAIAVGLTPELLPIIVTVSLSHGAGKLAKKKVVAKQLISIENLGNMDVLCTDKTGTLTEGNIELVDYQDATGHKDFAILNAALLCNSALVHHQVLGDGIDVAIWKYALKNHLHPTEEHTKLDEEPFDYNRKAMYSVVNLKGKPEMLVKGSPDSVLAMCIKSPGLSRLEEHIKNLGNDGLRVIAVAAKSISSRSSYSWSDAKGMRFVGLISFLDVPKISAREALLKLHKLNVNTKVITGDNEIVAQKVMNEVGMPITGLITGPEIERLTDAELKNKVNDLNLFARMNPGLKLRVITALKANGHTVGYLGDGINDIPSLRGADVGISVNSAVDVAKEAASVVLLHKSLDVIADGIMEGRRTFSNTIKYILMSTSSNFGNMFSAAGASFFLPFLPMTPAQILLTNGLYDVSQLSIPSDNVDKESLIKPRHWNIDFIKSYMIFFGPLSSIYDFLTYGVMLFVFHARGALFQTGWFIESVATEILVVFVIRTSKTPFFLSRPSRWLALTCLGIVVLGIMLPFTPLAATLGFVSPPPLYFVILIVLVSTYLLLVETVKTIFLKRFTL